MKKIIQYFLRCIVLGVVNMVLLSILIRTPLFKDVQIYYYRIVYLVILDTLCCLGVMIALKKFLRGNNKFLNMEGVDIISVFLPVFLAMLFVVTIISMPLDRSYTIYSLVDLSENSNKVFTKEEIEQSFIDGYIYKLKATERRIEEQLFLRNIEKVDDGYKITQKGKRLIELFRIYEKIIPISEKRILYPIKEADNN